MANLPRPKTDATDLCAATILHAEAGRRLTKLFRGDAQAPPDDYDAGVLFNAEEIALPWPAFVARLASLPPTACLIRGAVRPEAREAVAAGPVRRLAIDREECLAAFEPAARNWIILDADHTDVPFDARDVETCVGAWLATLPEAIADARCAWFPSAQQHRTATLRGKLLVALATPLNDTGAAAWASAHGFDPSVCRAVQPNYLAAPVFVGCIDPLAGQRAPLVFDGPPATLPSVAPSVAAGLGDREPIPEDAAEPTPRAFALAASFAERWLAGDRVASNAALHLFGWLLGAGWGKAELAGLLACLDADEPDARKAAEHRHILDSARAIEGPGAFRAWCGDDWPTVDAAANPLTTARRLRREAGAGEAGETQPLILQSRAHPETVLVNHGPERGGYRRVAIECVPMVLAELGYASKPDAVGKRAEAPRAMIARLGGLYDATIYDFAARESRYDPSRGEVTLGYPIAPIAPTFDPRADVWLRALGGEDYPRLAEWIASCAQASIDRLAAALVLVGPRDTGKSLLASVVARLWGETPCPADSLVRQFNDDLLACPIVLDDEAELFGSRALSTKRFRNLIQQRERRIEAKHRGREKLRGALRFIVSCNAISDLRFRDVSGPDVIDAVADRIALHKLDAGQARWCLDALAALRLPGTHDVDVEAIVHHAAWIAKTTEIPSVRFIGACGGAATAVLAGHVQESADVWASLDVWLAGDDRGRGPWYPHDGNLAVDARGLATSLGALDHKWDLARVSAALAPVHRGTVRPRAIPGRPRLYVLDVDRLVQSGALDAESGAALAHRVGADRDVA